MTRDQVKDIVFRTFTDVIADDEIEITEDSGIMVIWIWFHRDAGGFQ